jgi:hypothetical protein
MGRVAQSTEDLLRAQVEESRLRCTQLEAQVADLRAELQRTLAWRWTVVAAVVVVAVIAILMLGIVAFNAVDDEGSIASLVGT